MANVIKATEKLRNVKEIHVKGVRWFQASYGNTYHRAYISVLKGGVWEEIGCTEIQYGYGEQYLESAGEWLIKNGYFEADQNNGHWFNRLALESMGIVLSYHSEDVKRKKYL